MSDYIREQYYDRFYFLPGNLSSKLREFSAASNLEAVDQEIISVNTRIRNQCGGWNEKKDLFRYRVRLIELRATMSPKVSKTAGTIIRKNKPGSLDQRVQLTSNATMTNIQRQSRCDLLPIN